MSLYNAVMGFNPACVLLMPMLGRTQQEYPRFRDCFLSEDHKYIDIYTRVGGGNRGCGYGEEELYKDENFVTTWDDDYDHTYGYYRFKVPERWQKDFDHIINSELKEVSEEYLDTVKAMFPKLADAGVIDKMFMRGDKEVTSDDSGKARKTKSNSSKN